MIVYILGAGASHDTLPIVKDFPERLRYRAETMHERARFLDDSMQLTSGRKPTQVLEDFTSNLKWLASQSSNHLSVDTFAKKLYVSGKEEDLLRMKATLACFLWIEQVLRPTQMRYDGFFAALVELKGNEVTLPNQVKIITWNYDSPIETYMTAYCHKGG